MKGGERAVQLSNKDPWTLRELPKGGGTWRLWDGERDQRATVCTSPLYMGVENSCGLTGHCHPAQPNGDTDTSTPVNQSPSGEQLGGM